MNKFSVLVADPPWFFFDSLKMSDVKRGAGSNYALMSNEDIKKIPVQEISDPNGSVLALWVPGSLLQEGLDVMKAWGFTHKQTYTWVKIKKNPLNFSFSNILSFGMGRLFRQTHEICLIGINNTGIYKKLSNKSQRSVSFGENLKHSAKPEHLQNSLDLMFPDSSLNKIEIFARRQRPGWLCIGNEAPMSQGEDIFNSFKKIISMTNFNLIKSLIDNYKDKDKNTLFKTWSSF